MQTRTVRSLQLGFVFSAALVALAFVSAALAIVSVKPTFDIITPARFTQVEKNQAGGITHIAKNQVWPIKGRITMDPCANFECVEL